MRQPEWLRSILPTRTDGQAPPASQRDRLAVLVAIVTFVGLIAAFILSKGAQLLMPGPLASAHGAIENCSACHTKSGSGKLSWVHGLVAGDPAADSKACLTCHKMPETAFNAHSASADVLRQSTERLTKIGARTPQPRSARAQSIAFPTHDVVARGLYCATCHQEHQGVNFKLSKISNEQCRSCHVVQFDSFDGHHPKFENYPFKRRTRIIYDHGGHFGKHYPEVAKKDPEMRIPDTCSTCHNSRADKRVMSVAPFEQTCTGCHLDQIIGKERASGPKGVAFLTLPGLDLATLRKKSAPIGEWPEASEAALTPFMRVLISRNERGRALIKTVDSLNLQDLTNASDGQIRAVTGLAWEIKGLFYALISGKASDVLGDLNIGGGAKLSATLVTDLTASIPRDVVISAHQEWLPNLATEMANRPVTSVQDEGGWSTTITESNSTGSASPAAPAGPNASIDAFGRLTKDQKDEAEAAKSVGASAEGSSSASTETEQSGSDASEANSSLGTEAASRKAANILNEQDCAVSIFGQCVLSKGGTGGAQAVKSEEAAGQTDAADPKPDGAGSAEAAPAGSDAGQASQPDGAFGKTYITNAGPDDGEEIPSADSGGAVGARVPLPGGTPRARTNSLEKPAQPEGAGARAKPARTQPDSGAATGAASKADAISPVNAPADSGAANANPDSRQEAPPAQEQPQGKTTDQSDDLLFPTEEEQRAIKAGSGDSEKSDRPNDAGGNSDAANAEPAGGASNAPADTPARSGTGAPEARAAPVVSIKSDIDPESWAEYGGWYRQDYAIFYRPTGHKDKFIYSWLFLTGPQAPRGDKSPAAAVFDYLTSKDAQGSCTKCHSVDDIQGTGRVVNFSPPSAESKRGRFTNFIHEPHFGVVENRAGTLENRGCLTCHTLEKGRPYLKNYEHGDPQNFVSNFNDVKKDLCQTCHTASMARQDCLLCHKYHVNGVVTPIMSTKLPTQ